MSPTTCKLSPALGALRAAPAARAHHTATGRFPSLFAPRPKGKNANNLKNEPALVAGMPVFPVFRVTRSFSAHVGRLRKQQPPRPRTRPRQEDAAPKHENRMAGLGSLGLSRGTRTALIAILSVYATIETWFWCKVIWRWWKGDPAETDGAK